MSAPDGEPTPEQWESFALEAHYLDPTPQEYARLALRMLGPIGVRQLGAALMDQITAASPPSVTDPR